MNDVTRTNTRPSNDPSVLALGSTIEQVRAHRDRIFGRTRESIEACSDLTAFIESRWDEFREEDDRVLETKLMHDVKFAQSLRSLRQQHAKRLAFLQGATWPESDYFTDDELESRYELNDIQTMPDVALNAIIATLRNLEFKYDSMHPQAIAKVEADLRFALDLRDLRGAYAHDVQ